MFSGSIDGGRPVPWNESRVIQSSDANFVTYLSNWR